jgi:hypothetical protein
MAPATEPEDNTGPPARPDAGSAAGHGGRWRPEAADGSSGRRGTAGARAWRLLVGEGERSGVAAGLLLLLLLLRSELSRGHGNGGGGAGSPAEMTRRLGFFCAPGVDARGRGADDGRPGWSGAGRSDGRGNLGCCDNYCPPSLVSPWMAGKDGFQSKK